MARSLERILVLVLFLGVQMMSALPAILPGSSVSMTCCCEAAAAFEDQVPRPCPCPEEEDEPGTPCPCTPAPLTTAAFAIAESGLVVVLITTPPLAHVVPQRSDGLGRVQPDSPPPQAGRD